MRKLVQMSPSTPVCAQRGGSKGYAHCRRPLLETLEDLLNAFGYLLETFGDLLETFGDLLETLGDLLGDSWRPTGYPWRLADPSWGPAGCSIVPLDTFWGCQMVSR